MEATDEQKNSTMADLPLDSTLDSHSQRPMVENPLLSDSFISSAAESSIEQVTLENGQIIRTNGNMPYLAVCLSNQ